MSEARFSDAELVTVPFRADDLRRAVAAEYRELLGTYESEEILVVTGSPTSSATFREVLADDVPGAAVPNVTSLVVHATDVLNQTDERAILSDAIRRELVHRFLNTCEWDSEYFRRAADQPSFPSDIAQLMETATWQDAALDTTPELVEIAEVVEAFHDWLDEHDHLERGQLISKAATAVADSDARDGLIDAEAILAVEFEEFLPNDRRYLAALAEDCELVCIAESDASVRRTWIETGPITDHVSFETERSAGGDAPATRPAATASYLARGTVHDDPDAGSVNVIAAESADEQLEHVADEIERLRNCEGWEYDDVAVALKHGGEGVIETIRALQQSNIPTESATAVGFGDDPAVREVLRVVRYLAADSPDRAALLDGDPILEASLLDALEGMDGLADPLRRWATESGLKVRIAEETPPLEARAQFGNVRRVFTMAEFVEETAFISPTWGSFAEMLERAHEYAPQQNQTSAIERDGGVRVDHVQALKNGAFRAVFLLNVVDEEYPGTPWLTRLFPHEWVSQMPDYPGVTQVEADDVGATFATDSTASSRPFRRYNAEHARRRLAVGAAAATDRLYVCLYEHEDSALDERVQPSRFLTDAYRQLPWLTDADDSVIESQRAAETYLLSRVDRALADVRRANSQDVTISLDEVEADLAEIQQLLDDSGEYGDGLREALRARVDFAAGRVRRE